jgi:hypothetical protein
MNTKSTKETATQNHNKREGKENLLPKIIQQMTKDKKISQTMEQLKDKKAKEITKFLSNSKSTITETN